VISYTKEERDTIKSAWTKLLAFAKTNGSDGEAELTRAAADHHRQSERDLISVKAQLLGLLVRAGDVRSDRVFTYLPPARTVITYSWLMHSKWLEKEAYKAETTDWDDVLVAAQDAHAALNAHLTRRATMEGGEGRHGRHG